MKQKNPIVTIVTLLFCALLLTGCGRSLVITTGFGRNEVFRLGKDRCRAAEVRVYLLDLQKQSESLFGDAIWDSGDSAALQQAVKDQALAQITRVKALNAIGISRNLMLSSGEGEQADKAGHDYYMALSEEEKKYIDLDEKKLQRMFREYALAEKTWSSLGDSAEMIYEQFVETTQCDLNTVLWQGMSLKKLEGEADAPGFAACYRAMFPEEEKAAPADEDAAGTGDTAAMEQEEDEDDS